jgi:hypothetical protein
MSRIKALHPWLGIVAGVGVADGTVTVEERHAIRATGSEELYGGPGGGVGSLAGRIGFSEQTPRRRGMLADPYARPRAFRGDSLGC